MGSRLDRRSAFRRESGWHQELMRMRAPSGDSLQRVLDTVPERTTELYGRGHDYGVRPSSTIPALKKKSNPFLLAGCWGICCIAFKTDWPDFKICHGSVRIGRAFSQTKANPAAQSVCQAACWWEAELLPPRPRSSRWRSAAVPGNPARRPEDGQVRDLSSFIGHLLLAHAARRFILDAAPDCGSCIMLFARGRRRLRAHHRRTRGATFGMHRLSLTLLRSSSRLAAPRARSPVGDAAARCAGGGGTRAFRRVAYDPCCTLRPWPTRRAFRRARPAPSRKCRSRWCRARGGSPGG